MQRVLSVCLDRSKLFFSMFGEKHKRNRNLEPEMTAIKVGALGGWPWGCSAQQLEGCIPALNETWLCRIPVSHYGPGIQILLALLYPLKRERLTVYNWAVTKNGSSSRHLCRLCASHSQLLKLDILVKGGETNSRIVSVFPETAELESPGAEIQTRAWESSKSSCPFLLCSLPCFHLQMK
jgi:hypothetical protein